MVGSRLVIGDRIIETSSIGGVEYISSIDISIFLLKKHKNLMRDIRQKGNLSCVIESQFTTKQNKTSNMYFLPLRVAYSILSEFRTNTSGRADLMIAINKKLGVETVVQGMERAELEFEREIYGFMEVVGVNIESQKRFGKYRVDFFIESKSIIIEFDEAHHAYNFKKDMDRQKEIEDISGCTFIRLPYDRSIGENIGTIAKCIMRSKRDY
jgi:very-short-patch-repair endonuclease